MFPSKRVWKIIKNDLSTLSEDRGSELLGWVAREKKKKR